MDFYDFINIIRIAVASRVSVLSLWFLLVSLAVFQLRLSRRFIPERNTTKNKSSNIHANKKKCNLTAEEIRGV